MLTLTQQDPVCPNMEIIPNFETNYDFEEASLHTH